MLHGSVCMATYIIKLRHHGTLQKIKNGELACFAYTRLRMKGYHYHLPIKILFNNEDFITNTILILTH